MKYRKYTINVFGKPIEVARAFKDKDAAPLGEYVVDGVPIHVTECSYKEKYRIWRRGKNKWSDIVRSIK